MQKLFFFLFLASFLLACEQANNQSTSSDARPTKTVTNYLSELNMTTDTLEVATFSGAHFYGLEAVFQQLKGTEHVLSGYTGGRNKGPGFEEVNSGRSNTAWPYKSITIPKRSATRCSWRFILSLITPPAKKYRASNQDLSFNRLFIFMMISKKKLAQEELEKNKKKSKYKGKTIHTTLQPYSEFWIAELEHQDYALNNKEEDYVQNVIRPYLRSVEKKYGAWMVRGKAVFPVTQNTQPQNPDQ